MVVIEGDDEDVEVVVVVDEGRWKLRAGPIGIVGFRRG